MDLLIRQADAGDVGSLAALFAASALSNPGDREAFEASPDVLGFSPRPVEEGRTRIATTADGRIVGFCSVLVEADVLEVEDLFVDPAWQRRGIGRRLIVDAVAMARKHRVARVVVTSNNQARRFYEKVGFVFDREVATRLGPAAEMSLDPRSLCGDGDASSCGRRWGAT